MTNQPELKACPLCGATAKVGWIAGGEKTNPAIDGTFFEEAKHHISCPTTLHTVRVYGRTFLEAADKWNTRADLSPKWQGMDTAPKDQTQVLVYKYAADTFDHLYCVAYFYQDKWLSVDDEVEFYNPSHWLSLDALPPPPAETT